MDLKFLGGFNTCPLTLTMASAQVVETSVANNSPFQYSDHPNDHFQSRCILLGANAQTKRNMITMKPKATKRNMKTMKQQRDAILLHKLNTQFGVHGTLLSWLTDYLTDRTSSIFGSKRPSFNCAKRFLWDSPMVSTGPYVVCFVH